MKRATREVHHEPRDVVTVAASGTGRATPAFRRNGGHRVIASTCGSDVLLRGDDVWSRNDSVSGATEVA